MPYTNGDRKTSSAELETTARVLRTVQKQIEMYSMSLEKIKELRTEFRKNPDIAVKAGTSVESLTEIFKSRGIPDAIASGMAMEDLKGVGGIGGGPVEGGGGTLGFWTWDCCCTGCCVTCFVGDTSICTEGETTIVK